MKEFAECAGHSQRSIVGKRTCGYGNYFKTILKSLHVSLEENIYRLKTADLYHQVGAS